MRGSGAPSQATMQPCGAAPSVRARSSAICARAFPRVLLEPPGEAHHGAAIYGSGETARFGLFDGSGSWGGRRLGRGLLEPLVPVRIVPGNPEIGRKSKGH